MGPGKKFIGLVTVALILFLVLYPALMPLATTSMLTKDGTQYKQVRHSTNGTLQSYTPQSTLCQLPTRIMMNGVAGETGHTSYGVLWMADGTKEDYDAVGVKLTMNRFSFENDVGVTRISLATMWKPLDPLDTTLRYYVEFDLWSNPAWNPSVSVLRYNCYSPWGTEPTIEIKQAQIPVGESMEFKIDAQGTFESLFKGVHAELDSVYLVIAKNDPASTFTLDVTLEELWLYPHVSK